VEAGSPADRAGLKLGDVLLSAAGHDVMTSQDLQRLMLAEAIGQPLAVTVVRNGAMVDVIAYPRELVTG
jgi:S1-C subfamily serine protease